MGFQGKNVMAPWWQPSKVSLYSHFLERSCLLLSYDRKILLCLTPFDGFSFLLRAYSLTSMKKANTTIRQTTHHRVHLLLRGKLVVQKIYWENVSEHRAKYKELELMREKKNRRTDPGNPTRDWFNMWDFWNSEGGKLEVEIKLWDKISLSSKRLECTN